MHWTLWEPWPRGRSCLVAHLCFPGHAHWAPIWGPLPSLGDSSQLQNVIPYHLGHQERNWNPFTLSCTLVFFKNWRKKRHCLSPTHISLYYFCCSVGQSCPTLCDPMDGSTPGFPVLHCLLELAQTHVHWVSDAIQPSHPLLPHSPPAHNLSQHRGFFQWVGSSHQVAKVLELQLQSFQWIFRTDFL